MRSLWFIMSACLLVAAQPVEAAKRIKVVMKTSDGVGVKARLKVKAYPAAAVDAFVLNEGNGYAIISLENCDDFVSISAVSTVVGIARKLDGQTSEWIPCKEPEVVFDDFYIQRFAISTSNALYRDTEFWRQTLGPAAVASKPDLPKQLASAYESQEYGKISIITTQLQNSLREAGKQQEADFMYSLAIEAAAQGVLDANNQPDLIGEAVKYTPSTKRFELTEDGLAAIKTYKVENLGSSRTDGRLGSIDWSTMKSLPGGAAVQVPNVTLDAKGIQSFEVKENLLAVLPH